MNIYVVSYDLKSDHDPDYEGVGAALEQCGLVNRFQKSVFLVASTIESASAIRDVVAPSLNDGDTLFVVKVEDSWAGWNTRLSAWIKEMRLK